jgi:hypothetical protein
MRIKTLLALSVGLIGAVVLTGCSSDTAPAPTSSASPSNSPKASSSFGVDDPSGRCIEGVATPAGHNGTFKLDGCALVDVVGNRNSITLGDTEHLTVEGDNNSIVVSKVGDVTTTGKNNQIYYSGDEPAFTELGSGSTVGPLSSKP